MLRVLLGEFQPRSKLHDSRLQGWKVLLNRRFDDCSRRVEIVVSQPVPHTGRVRPLDIRFAREELGNQQLDGFANLDQSSPNGVEDESVEKIATSEVTPDCCDRAKNIGKALLVVSCPHSGMASRLTSSRTRDRRLSEGATSTETPRISESSLRSASKANSPVFRSKSTTKSTSLLG